jgi:hypothetical protein
MDWLRKVSSSFKGINVVASFLMLAVLSACGGSDSGFVDNGGTGGGGTTVNVTTVTMSISSTNVDAANPADVTATVADNNGPLAGVVVTFTTTLGVLDPTSGTALTDANGQATLEIHPGDVEGAGEITAAISSGESGIVGFTSAGDGTAIAGKVLTISSSTVSVASATPATLTVTVTDGGAPVAGEVITFSTSLGILDPASGTALTNAAGQALITLGAGTEEGAGLVTATASSGESTFIGFETAGDGSIIGGRALTVVIDNNSVDAANPRNVTATLTDGGTPVANEVVSFSSTLGVLDPISGTALTDAAGQADIILAAGTVEGAGVVRATLATGEVNIVGFTTAGDGTSLGGRSLVISIDNPFVDSANPRTLTATLLDAGTPVAGEVVTFTNSLGILDPSSGTALTDAAGQATITLAAGTIEGAGVATATVATGEADTIGFDSAGDGTNIGGRSLVVTIDNPSVDSANPRNLTATLLDAGTPIANEVVTFTTSLGVLDPISGTALTDAAGQATIVLAAGVVEGAGVATATVATGEADTLGFNTAGDGTVLGGRSLVITIDNPSIDSANPRNLTATLLDAGAPVANEVVTFTTTLGVLDPISGTALTDAAGQATIVLAAGVVEGAGVATATVATGEADTLGFNTAGDGTVLGGRSLVVSIDNPSVDAANPRTVTATLLDAGTPIANEVVTFTTSLGVLDPLSGTALTDAAGQATITLAAGTIEGAGVATATVATGEADTLGFSSAGDGTAIGGRSLVVTIDNPSVDAANPRTVTATLLDAGTPVANEVVTFTTSLGVLDPTSGTALTDAAGQATIILAAGTVEGAGVVTATVATGEADTLGFDSAGDGAVSGSRSLAISIDNPSVDAANPRTLTATLLDGGAPVANEVVTFTSTLGSLDPASGTALTDAAGQATITLTAGTVEGAGVAAATVATGETDSLGFSSAGDEVSIEDRILDLVIDNPSVDAANPRNLTATFTDGGVPIAGQLITFSTTIGVLDPSSGTALTDVAGVATMIITAGTIEGAGVVTATSVTGETNSVGFTTAGDDSPNAGRSLSIAIDNTSVDAANPRTLTATLTDDGAAVVGEVVTFTTTLGALDPVSGTALTDGAGQATITLTAGSVNGAGTATVSTGAGETDSVGFVTAGDIVSSVTVSLELTDVNGVILDPRQISRTNPGKIEATVTGIVDPVLVTFSSDLGSIPVNTAITDGSDVATVDINASDSLGAGTITATLVTGETAQMVFSIGASSLGIGTSVLDGSNNPDDAIEIPAGNVSAGGTTTLSVTIWDTSGVGIPVPYTDPVDVEFSSTCGAAGLSLIDSPVTSVNGVATATYLAQGCEIADPVTATANAGGIILSATGTVTVDPASLGSIQFISATPENIVLQGTGAVGGSESSTLVFLVLDTNGNPVTNQSVDFTLNTNVGGVAVSPASASTDSNGNVQTVVTSGTAATSVRVTATTTLGVDTVTTQSSLLIVSTGMPDQDSLTIAASVLNPEGWSIAGNEVTITAFLADAFNNPAPDGTAVSFTTEGGSIASSCTTVSGTCNVLWTSQNPLPEGQELGGADPEVNNTLGQSFGGRATVVATAIGNESFPDLNGNGVYDATEETDFAGNNVSGEPYDLPEAFVDYNEDGVFDNTQPGAALETFIDFDADATYDAADTEYNGVLCGDATNCSTEQSINIRRSLVLVMADGTANFATSVPAGGADISIVGEGTGTAEVIIADFHNQQMPAGTTVEFEATVGSIVSSSSFTWPSSNHNGGRAFSVIIKGEATPVAGTLIVTVTSPSGVVSIYSVATIDIT